MVASKTILRGDRIGHRFAEPQLLAQALTHRSAGAPHNERLEFLGDGIVNLLIAEALYQRWPKADEGALTRARAELVREASLAAIGRQLELGERLTLGPGEMKSGGHRRDSILADAVEAVVAAIYLDAGFETCRRHDPALVRGGAGGAAGRQGGEGRQDPPAGMAAGPAAAACRPTN